MPSDCQCSTACDVRVETKVLNNKQATRKLKELEAEVTALEEENQTLKRRLRKARVSKKSLVKKLKNHLDGI